MKNFGSIFLLTLVVSLLYTAVGHLVPQLENRPPPEVEAGTNIGPEELAAAGAGVFEANCVQCHKMGEAARGPDLGNIGRSAHGRAAERAATTGRPYGDVDYLLESLCRPGDYLVDGFGNIMPPQGKSMSGGQLLAVSAFLQEQGGEATIKGTDVEGLARFGCGAVTGGASAAVAVKEMGSPEEIYDAYGCSTCHAIDSDERKLGPSLKGIGKRLSKGDIYESLLVPDATIAAGTPPYPAGLMKQTLGGNGFYEQMAPKDYQALVNWLVKK